VGERELDVVVFGATSVTGRRVCAYLAERAEQSGARWAPAARDAAKAKSVLGECGVSVPETIVADVTDEASLAAMVSRTRVVLNLVGPYTHHGRPVIEACVAGGAHYVDLTGEIPFVRRMIDEFDSTAAEAGVKVVQVSGFEALPADLAVLLAAEAARERFGEALEGADLEVEIGGLPWPPRPSDVLSGGTLQSMAAIAAGDDEFDFKDPACLITDPLAAEKGSPRQPDLGEATAGHRWLGLGAHAAGRVHQSGGDPPLDRAARRRAAALPRGSAHPRAARCPAYANGGRRSHLGQPGGDRRRGVRSRRAHAPSLARPGIGVPLFGLRPSRRSPGGLGLAHDRDRSSRRRPRSAGDR